MSLFNIDKNTQEGNKASSKLNLKNESDFIQKGKLTKIELSEDQKYITYEFTNDKGQVSDKRQYLPKNESEYDDPSKYTKAVEIFMNNMVNVVRRYKGEDYTLTGSSAQDVASKVIASITPLLGNKEIYCLHELQESSKGIFTRIGSFAPFSIDGSNLSVNPKQLELLNKKNNFRSDSDNRPVTFEDTPGNSNDLPF